MDLITVIIPTYNRENTITKSVMSVLSQSYKEIELIVVDDGSTDDTISNLKNIDDSRLHIEHQAHQGACAARNLGIKLARGKYIAFQDSDDEWLPNKLTEQLSNLKLHDSDIDFCSMKTYSKEKNYITPNFPINNSFNLEEKLLISNFISTQMLLVKKKCFDKVKFDESFPRFQDWDLLLTLCQKYKLSHTDSILVKQYISNDSISNNIAKANDAYEQLETKYSSLYSHYPRSYAKFLYNWSLHCKKYLTKKDQRNILALSLKYSLSLKTVMRFIETYL
ncbi:glycosyltransferase family 2 protein [Bifidobacterium felsineum]|uniref:glycosyltransferase family 2 protein n=1 Tax=Bifidobacterium felsineum TaxID=2045440 RepID=UPI001BDC04AC|nr:glycosyltransferase family 2 protein [Bifidobacterium felsineum]MBT1164909.1 glycosyltransferase family 2 protein [Bifidobacterium felsineum]